MKVDLEMKRKFGCGITFIGRTIAGVFRPEHYAGIGLDEMYSEVEYVFFTLFYMPIFPLGCKRTVMLSHSLNNGVPAEYVHKKKIIKSEKARFWEVFEIYAICWIPLIALVTFVSLCK